jgi:hypothetical protein
METVPHRANPPLSPLTAVSARQLTLHLLNQEGPAFPQLVKIFPRSMESGWWLIFDERY